jgi:hypothetical protein
MKGLPPLIPRAKSCSRATVVLMKSGNIGRFRLLVEQHFKKARIVVQGGKVEILVEVAQIDVIDRWPDIVWHGFNRTFSTAVATLSRKPTCKGRK